MSLTNSKLCILNYDQITVFGKSDGYNFCLFAVLRGTKEVRSGLLSLYMTF